MKWQGTELEGIPPAAHAGGDVSDRRRRPAVLGRSVDARPRGEGRWAASDVLATAAVILALFGITGYVNATPLGSAEDDPDELFAETWDQAGGDLVPGAGTLLELVSSAQADQDVPAALQPSPPASASVIPPDRPGDVAQPTLPPAVPSSTPVAAVTTPESPTVGPSNAGSGGADGEPTDAQPAPTELPRPDVRSGAAPAPPSGTATLPNGPTEPPDGPAMPAPRQAVPPEIPSTDAGGTDATPVPAPAPVPLATPPPVPITTPTPVPTEVTPVSTAVPLEPAATPGHAPTSAPTATSPTVPAPSSTPTGPVTPTPAPSSVIISTDAPVSGFMEMENMRPGARITRSVNVVNGGRLPFLSYTLTTVAVNAPTPLWTDPINGLHLRVTRDTSVIYEGPIAVTDLDLGATVAPGATDTVDLTVYVPHQAGNVIQGHAQTITIIWTATGG